MNFDIAPLQTTISPLALLAGPQVAAPSDEFAVLMDIGAPPPKSNRPVEYASAAQALETIEVPKPSELSTTTPPDANPAIAQADALVIALSSEAKSPKMLEKSSEALTSMTPESILAVAPVLASTSNPIAVTFATRNANSPSTAADRHQPSKRLAPMARETLDVTVEDESETVVPGEESFDNESALRIIPAEQIVPMPAVIQVSPTPIPLQGAAVVPSETTFETTNSPSPANAKLEPTPNVSLEGDGLAIDDKISIENFRSIAIDVEEQTPEIQPQSLSTTRSAGVASKPIDNQEPLLGAAAAIIVNSEDHFARKEATKIAPSHKIEVPEALTTTANIVEDSVTIPTIKSVSDLQTVASPLPAIVNAPVSTIDTILDRQLDLVRNERWLGELAQDIASTSDNKDRLSFRLMPHQLGRLDIDVSRSHSGISLTIRTESDSAQSILTAAQPRLADELRAQGVRLADTQMFSSDARHSQHHGSAPRPVSLIENSFAPTDTNATEAPEQAQRDGRYA